MLTVKVFTKQSTSTSLIFDCFLNLAFIRLDACFSPSVGIGHPETYGLDVLDLAFHWLSPHTLAGGHTLCCTGFSHERFWILNWPTRVFVFMSDFMQECFRMLRLCLSLSIYSLCCCHTLIC